MSDVTYPVSDEKTRINVSVPVGTREKLIGLAGGERSIGALLTTMVDQAGQGAHDQFECSILDGASIRQIMDSTPAVDPALPSAEKKKRGVGGAIVFGCLLWVNGSPVPLKFGYDANKLGWASSSTVVSTLSAALAHLAGQGWEIKGIYGDMILLQRQRVAPSVN